MRSNTYIGLTIGPIVKTLQSSRRTGELWGASYIFSYIMKKISEKIINEICGEDNFIIPYIGDKEIFTDNNEVGVFHDRLIFRSEGENDLKKLPKIVNSVLNQISKKISEDLDENYDLVNNFVKSYFQIYFLEVEIKLESKENIILTMSKYLDVIELREDFVTCEEDGKNYILNLLTNENIKKSFLKEDAFGKNPIWKDAFEEKHVSKYENRYPALIEIGASELGLKLPNEQKTDDNEDQMRHLKDKEKKKLKKVHRYVAIVQADGDAMTEVINSLSSSEDYRKFSKKLFDFAKEANTKIKSYQGFTIYAGGDDLLFFAPVINNEKTIFDLLDEISNIFEGYFSEYEKKPTLSFGMSIAHHKYPLYEFLEKARESLFINAKKFKTGNKKKNAIAFKVIKHSGQYFGNTFSKDSKAYKSFKEILKEYADKGNEGDKEDKDDSKFLHSLQNKIIHDKKLISCICHSEEKLKNYFYNNYNEDIHKENKSIGKYLQSVEKIIFEASKESEFDKAIEQVYSYLKFLTFINEKDKVNENKRKEKEKNNE
ncbi:type III-B CRISPR-associated protein Cas10/Cmr2 [Clostridium pasteurianum]|uniref:type III-B CRISPR-associated protein Cas10/Cmr2 n=1 Tax=Clostridium pasteurianum TaxID=1501 RepID=UPI002260D711|nr:type III-B CRISPR-associated protein Cas10/Cmr2 [Clostridium pasteurianum]UZW14962.1 type III-B CRISPR-associated protein Cas10/Cmr2 [Clostridium pasteurianum]